MNERLRVVLAFVFNLLLPGLAFHYSGTKHNIRWLRSLGLVTMIVFFFAVPTGVAILFSYAYMNYHFTLQELAPYLAFVLVSAFLGAGIEWKLSEDVKP